MLFSSGDPNFHWIRPFRQRQAIRSELASPTHQAPQLNGTSTFANLTANKNATRVLPPAVPRHCPQRAQPRWLQPHAPHAHTEAISPARRSLLGQRASDDRFALRMHTVAKSVESEPVRTRCVGFHQTVCEFSYLANSGSLTVLTDYSSRLGSGVRERRPLIKLLVLWH